MGIFQPLISKTTTMSINTTNKKRQTLLILLNITLIFLVITLIYKGGYHIKIYDKLKYQMGIGHQKVSDDQLKAMNNEYSAPFIDIEKGNIENQELRIAIIGNSLTSHAIAEKIGWTHESGMAASSIDKDYVHLLATWLSDIPHAYNVKLRLSNIAPFERNPNLVISSIDSLISFSPEIVIFQLGENVAETDDLDLFKQKYIELVNRFTLDDRIIICTTPFFPDANKNAALEEVALQTSSYLVDLSSLVLLDSQNYAKDEVNYLGDRTLWKASGIGIHPGDIGMENIAKRLLITTTAAIANKTKPSHKSDF